MSLMPAPIFVLLLTIICLSFWIWRLTREQQQTRQEQSNVRVQRHLRTLNSLLVLARALLDDQVELSEASLRIKMLLDSLPSDWLDRQGLEIFEQLYIALQGHPTHASRAALLPAERMKLDMQRWELEVRSRDTALTAASMLQQRCQLKLASLSL